MDLLVHERRPAALLGGRGVPVHREPLRLGHLVAFEIGHRHRIGGDADGLVLPQFHRVLGVGHERRDIRAEEVLPFAQTDDQRGVMARADHHIRLPAVHRQDRERTGQLPGHAAQRLEQIGLAGLGDHLLGHLAQQLGRHLAVRAGRERVAFGLQLALQHVGVLDDAVVDDGDVAVRAQVRMGVVVARGAVRGPTGVADAHRGLRQGVLGQVGLQIGQTTRLLPHGHMVHTRGGQCHARGVIATVFQTLQALQTHFQRFAARC